MQNEILNACKTLIANLTSLTNNSILSMGLSVQRSTFLFWDRENIKPVTMALSWQDSSSKNIVEKIKEHSDWVYKNRPTSQSSLWRAKISKNDHR